MNEISKLVVETEEYDIKDAQARENLATLETDTRKTLGEFRERVQGVQYKGICAETDRWCVFDFADENKKSILIKANTHIALDVTKGEPRRLWFDVDKDTSFDLSEGMAEVAEGADFAVGRTFFVYIVPDGDKAKLVVSLNSTFPNDVNEDYTASNTRKIAWFSTMCADCGDELTGKLPVQVGGVKNGDAYPAVPVKDEYFSAFYRKKVKLVTLGTYYDVAEVVHPLAGFKAGDIVPESVWCITFRPVANGGAMVYNPVTDTAIDIYKTSGTGAETTSEFGGLVTHSRPWRCVEGDMIAVNRRLLRDVEFTSAAMGSNVSTIAAADDTDNYKVLHAGGHYDTAGRAMVSFIGIWDACGAGWEVSDDLCNYGVAIGADDGQSSFGYGANSFVSSFGGARNSAVAAIGPCARFTNAAIATAGADRTSRGASAIVRGL